MPIAEETGLIVSIGQWVLEEACRWTQRWQACATSGKPLIVTVNLSARQFQHPELLADIKRALHETGTGLSVRPTAARRGDGTSARGS